MSDTLVVLGWVALGLCVGLVAGVLPFRRGNIGVAVRMGVAMGAALVGGLLGRAMGFYSRYNAPLSFGFAVATALLVTLAVQVVVVRRRGERSLP